MTRSTATSQQVSRNPYCLIRHLTRLKDSATYDDKYNDLPLVIDEAIYAQLRESGIDHLLARHLAHLFIRDPLVIYEEKLELDDSLSTDHFEVAHVISSFLWVFSYNLQNIQSTNWQTMRFKPPPLNSSIGWRVEFRSLEVQITDHENAAFAVFIVLLTHVILANHLNLYIPITKVRFAFVWL